MFYIPGNTERASETLPTEAQIMLSFAGAGVPRSSIELLEQGAINTIETPFQQTAAYKMGT